MEHLEIFRLLLIILLFENNERRDECQGGISNINQLLIFFLLLNPFDSRRDEREERRERREDRDTTF